MLQPGLFFLNKKIIMNPILFMLLMLIIMQYTMLLCLILVFKKKFDWYMYVPFGPHIMGGILLTKFIIDGLNNKK